MDITSYILGRNAGSSGANVKYVVVEELPQIGEEGTIYLVPKSTSKTNNYYDEYMYINSSWELIGDTQIDLSDYQKTIQYTIVPNATADNVGKIIQYTGTTTASYTNGYFYICVEDNNTYSWENLNVQDAGGMPSNLAKIYLCTSKVGGSSGELFNVCKQVYDDNKNGIKSAMFLHAGENYQSKNTTDGLYFYSRDTMYGYKRMLRQGIAYINSRGSSITNIGYATGMIDLTVVNDEVTSVTGAQIGQGYQNFIIETNYDYSTPYTPQYAGSPATKKYVDDSISSAITDALTGSY